LLTGRHIRSSGATDEIRVDIEKVEKRQSNQAKTTGTGILFPELSSPRLVCNNENHFLGIFFSCDN
jgi:hypothetical protein